MSTRRWSSLILAAAGGAISTLAYAPTSWWPIIAIGLGALIHAIRGHTIRWAALSGFVWAFTFFAIHLWWAAVATAIVPWIALTTLQTVFIAAGCAAYQWVILKTPWLDTPVRHAAVFAVIFTATEQLRSVIPFGGFPWGLIAYTQVTSPLGRWAWLGGQSLITIIVCFSTALIITTIRRHQWRSMATVAAFLLLPLALPLSDEATAGTITIGAVQGNVTEPGLGSFANRGEVLTNHVEGTKELLTQVKPGELDVVLWPENGSDLDPQEAPDVADAIDDAATSIQAPILVGAQEFPESGGRYNVLLLWEPGAGVTDRYAKQHPAPFGEYMPLRSILRVFSDQVDRITIDMIPGGQVGLMNIPTRDGIVPVGTLICFEVAYEPLIVDSIHQGAQFLVIPTNNASFGFTAESDQQLAMSQLRALETGRATVQISTVGVSGVISPTGAILESTKLFTADQLVATLPLRTTMTPAVRWGHLLTNTVYLVAAALLVTATSRPKKKAYPRRNTAGPHNEAI